MTAASPIFSRRLGAFERTRTVPEEARRCVIKAEFLYGVHPKSELYMKFEERELKPYAEPIEKRNLKEGDVYFAVQYVDDEMLIPSIETVVYVGRRLHQDEGVEYHYFQDIYSHREGIRLEIATAENAEFQVVAEDGGNHIFEYERALEQLMACSLRRRRVR